MHSSEQQQASKQTTEAERKNNMSMEYGANYADTIEEAFVSETCPAEFAAFQEAREELDMPLGENMPFDDNLDNNRDNIEEETYRLCKAAYSKLLSRFRQKTGLTLSLSRHDSDESGCKGDEIDGEFWSVDGVWQLTKAGKKYKGKIERLHFVTFG